MKYIFASSLILSLIACSSQSQIQSRLVDGIVLSGKYRENSNVDGRIFLYSDKEEELIIAREETMTLSEAQSLIVEKLALFQSILHPSADPYFGRRDLGTTCSESSLPKQITAESADFISHAVFLYATDEHVYGLCNSDLEKKKSQVLFLYCKKRKAFFELRSFYPASRNWQLAPIAICAL